jgi:chorismate dehydratase
MKICAVSYLNTKPFLYGLEKNIPDTEIILQIPSLCVENFKNHHSEMALIPAGSLVDFHDVTLIDNYCIGANDKVDSVFLFAHQPIKNLKKIYLDAHSRTSNGLIKILTKYHWNQKIEFVNTPYYKDSFEYIQKEIGAVVIGDRAIQIKRDYPYVYDLAYEWKLWTGLPFVFAVWAFHFEPYLLTKLPLIKDAFQFGLEHIDDVATIWSNAFGASKDTVLYYFQNNISYELTTEKKEALKLYLHYLSTIENLPLPCIRYF